MARAKAGAKGSAAKKGKPRRKAAKKQAPSARNKNQPLCDETTAKGTPCKNPAREGSTKCGPHGGNIGPKTKFTKALAASILIWMEQGAYAKEACEAAGITEETLYAWVREGNADLEAGRKSELSELSESYRQSKAKGMLALLAEVRKATGGGDGRLALDVMARKDPKRWGKKKIVEVSGPGGKPLNVPESTIDLSKLTPAKRKALRELHEEARREDKPEKKGTT